MSSASLAIGLHLEKHSHCQNDNDAPATPPMKHRLRAVGVVAVTARLDRPGDRLKPWEPHAALARSPTREMRQGSRLVRARAR